MGWIWSIIIGGIIGWLASIIMKTNAQMGLLWNIVIGVAGSIIGRYIATAVGLAPGAVLGFVISIATASLLIFILSKLGIFKKKA